MSDHVGNPEDRFSRVAAQMKDGKLVFYVLFRFSQHCLVSIVGSMPTFKVYMVDVQCPTKQLWSCQDGHL